MFTTPLDTLPPERHRNFMPTNSANWRRYSCLWEIREDRLYLTDIEGSICTAAADPSAPMQACEGRHPEPCQVREATVSDFSDGADGPVFADWYTGDLKVPRGKLVEYVHMGFASQYENYLMLTIAQGLLKGERIVAGPTPPRLLQRWARGLPAGTGVTIFVGIVSASALVLSFTAFRPSSNELLECIERGRSSCGDAHFPALLLRIAGFFGCLYAARLWSKRR
jgi:hypothetical protein